MSTPEDEKGIPEWSIFDRLDELEKIALEQMDKTGTMEPKVKDTATTARDAQVLSIFGLAIGFEALFLTGRFKDPRKLKDSYIRALKRLKLNLVAMEAIDDSLVKICENIEKSRAGGQ